MYDTVLVPTDGSEVSFTAAEEAVALTAEDGTLHVLSVVEELPMYKRSAKPEKFDEDDGARREQAEHALEQVEELAASAGVDYETAIAEGVPSREIVARAEAIEADAVVLGKRGLSDAANDMLGSTTERVVRDAPAVVVSVSE
jgi:nucleotide-binding universal stress UspA family protein